MCVIYKKYFLPMILLKNNNAGAEGQPAFLVISLREAVLRSGKFTVFKFPLQNSIFWECFF